MTNNFIELSEVLASLDPEYLEHHGIKGQKWGVEHGPPYPLKRGVSARIKRAAKSVKNRVEANRKQRAAKKEAKEAKRKAKHPTLQDQISAMSDEELRKRTERLRLENAYKRELPNEKQGESFLRKASKSLNEMKSFGDAVSGFIESGKRLSHAFGLDAPKGDDESPNRRKGESLKDYTQRMAQLASLKKSRETLGDTSQTNNDSQNSSAKKKDETLKPTSTAKNLSDFKDPYTWGKDKTEKESRELSSLREQAKKWNIDIDKPAEHVWDWEETTKGANWFKENFPTRNPEGGVFTDFVKDDEDEKKKKGG